MLRDLEIIYALKNFKERVCNNRKEGIENVAIYILFKKM